MRRVGTCTRVVVDVAVLTVLLAPAMAARRSGDGPPPPPAPADAGGTAADKAAAKRPLVVLSGEVAALRAHLLALSAGHHHHGTGASKRAQSAPRSQVVLVTSLATPSPPATGGGEALTADSVRLMCSSGGRGAVCAPAGSTPASAFDGGTSGVPKSASFRLPPPSPYGDAGAVDDALMAPVRGFDEFCDRGGRGDGATAITTSRAPHLRPYPDVRPFAGLLGARAAAAEAAEAASGSTSPGGVPLPPAPPLPPPPGGGRAAKLRRLLSRTTTVGSKHRAGDGAGDGDRPRRKSLQLLPTALARLATRAGAAVTGVGGAADGGGVYAPLASSSTNGSAGSGGLPAWDASDAPAAAVITGARAAGTTTTRRLALPRRNSGASVPRRAAVGSLPWPSDVPLPWPGGGDGDSGGGSTVDAPRPAAVSGGAARSGARGASRTSTGARPPAVSSSSAAAAASEARGALDDVDAGLQAARDILEAAVGALKCAAR